MDKFASHIVYDLNASQASSPIPTDKTFDLIVLAEVIEHLHTAPELVLARLGSLLRPGGYLIIQTPNAAALYKRLYVLAGFNPFERISLSAEAPGHFREYTRRELIAIASQAGLEIVGHDYKDYFGVDAHHKYWLKLHGLLAMIVPSFARGQTLVARKPSS